MFFPKPEWWPATVDNCSSGHHAQNVCSIYARPYWTICLFRIESTRYCLWLIKSSVCLLFISIENGDVFQTETKRYILQDGRSREENLARNSFRVPSCIVRYTHICYLYIFNRCLFSSCRINTSYRFIKVVMTLLTFYVFYINKIASI